MQQVFHLLTPVKEIEPGWYKLKWRPIKNGTYNLFITDTRRSWNTKFLGVMYHNTSAHNGWGRDYDAFSITIGLIFFTITFWLHYNISCMAEGAKDGSQKIPLDFSKSKIKPHGTKI